MKADSTGRKIIDKQTREKPSTHADLLDCLSEFLAPGPEESVEDHRSYLRDEGVNPDRVVARVRQLVDAKLKEDRLEWQAKAQQERMMCGQRLAALNLPGRLTRDEMFARVREILAGTHSGRPAFAHFRNFEQVTDDDLRSLLEDYQRMLALENLEASGEENPRGEGNGRS